MPPENAIYTGVPMANTAFNLAQGILREVAGDVGYVVELADARGGGFFWGEVEVLGARGGQIPLSA